MLFAGASSHHVQANYTMGRADYHVQGLGHTTCWLIMPWAG